MKEKRTDLRTQKVYDALIEAFTELLSEKTFEKITVKELCDRARTRTATFYNHFEDKYDFFAFMILEKRRAFMEEPKLTAENEKPEEYYISFIRKAFDFIEENMRMIGNILPDTMLDMIMNTMSKEMSEQLKEHLKKDAQQFQHRGVNEELLTQMFIGAVSQSIKWWLTHQKEMSKEDIVRQFTILMEDFFRQKRSDLA